MKRTPETPSPPAWALRLLKRFCPDDLYEMIEGDLLEEFEDNVEQSGKVRASRRFIWSTIRFLHPYIISKRKWRLPVSSNMTMHYLTSAFRHLTRHKLLSFINIVGLTVGIATFFLIVRYVSFETSYENFHINKDRIYRVAYHLDGSGSADLSSATNFIGITSLVEEHLPEVTAATTFDHTARHAYFQFIYGHRTFHQQTPFFQTDENFFKVFPSLLERGDPGSALADPHNLVISKKMAAMIFGNEDPMGKKIENRSYGYSQVGSFVVTGVMIDVPDNSHFHPDFIAKDSYEDEFAVENRWIDPRFYVYVTLAPGTDPVIVTEKINSLLKGLSNEHPKVKGVAVDLQPITEIHNYSNLAEELEPNGNATLLYILSAIAVAIIVSAWINYVNIATGLLLSRTKEIGVRKTLGSSRTDLTVQFLLEYFTTTLIATAFACMILVSAPSNFKYWSSPLWQTACIVFFTGTLITGIFLATKFPGRQHKTINAPFRNSLITFQFASSICLIAMMMVINNQLDLVISTNKKIDIENIVSIRNPTVYTNEDSLNYIEFNAFRNELLSSTMIKQATGSSAIPGMEVEVAFMNRIKRNLGDPYDPTPFKILFIDYDYLPFYNVRLKAGRNYSIDNGEDRSWSTILINETAARSLGFGSAQEAVDQEVYFHLFGTEFNKFRIVGVVEDYYHETAKEVIRPTILSLNHRRFQQVFFSVKLNKGTDPHKALAFIEASWTKLFPDKPFEYFFQDEFYDKQFKTDRRFRSVIGFFTGITILIASLGIVGMTLFETNARLKEVSVRKVLGASVVDLVALLSSRYFRIIIVASICCVPVIYYLSITWLDNYPLKITMSLWFFVVPVILLAALVMISSGWQTMKAAMTNPIEHLKHE